MTVAKNEYEREKGQALQEFTVSIFKHVSCIIGWVWSQAKKSEIKESLVMDLQEKKKTFENLRSTMEITTGSCELMMCGRRGYPV